MLEWDQPFQYFTLSTSLCFIFMVELDLVDTIHCRTWIVPHSVIPAFTSPGTVHPEMRMTKFGSRAMLMVSSSLLAPVTSTRTHNHRCSLPTVEIESALILHKGVAKTAGMHLAVIQRQLIAQCHTCLSMVLRATLPVRSWPVS